MTFEFDEDTAVTRVDDATFAAQVTERWNTFAGPNGGYILSIAARALAVHLPMPDPLAVSAHFLRPATPGPATIHVESLKSGRRHASALTRLQQNGKDVLVALGTYADVSKASGRELLLNEPPALRDPDGGVDPGAGIDPAFMPPIAQRFVYRTDAPPGFALGKPSGRPAYDAWIRFADGREPDPLALTMFPDALFPTIFEIGELISTTVEMSVHVRAVPAPGWLTMRVSSRHITGGYHEEDVEIWDQRGTFVAQARQLALLGG
jgi:acyl-CoA thioesterase